MINHLSKDEIDLLNQLKKGDEHAFTEIYNKYWKVLFNHAYKRLPDQNLIEGLVQDIFTDLWYKREKIEIHTSLNAYLFTALKFKIINHIKAKTVRANHANSIKLTYATSQNQVEEHVFHEELKTALEKELSKLPPQPRKVYSMKRMTGLSYIEIAEKLQISTSTVEKHMIKALKILRKNLKEYAVLILVFFC